MSCVSEIIQEAAKNPAPSSEGAGSGRLDLTVCLPARFREHQADPVQHTHPARADTPQLHAPLPSGSELLPAFIGI